jgi:hypothetical protein
MTFFVELHTSKMMYRFSPHNKTWINFLQCIQVMSGGGHFNVTTAEGTFPDTSKANTTGLNFVLGLFSQLFGYVLERINICNPGDNLMGIVEIPNWTPKALELATCGTTVGGKVSYVPPTLNGIMAMPEIRGSSDLNAMVSNGLPRGRLAGREQAMNTVEGSNDKKNNRELMERPRIANFLGVTAMSCNKRCDRQTVEPCKSLMAVSHVLPPGTAVVVKGTKKQKGLNGVAVNAYSGVSGTPVQQETLGNVLVYPYLVCEICALMNHIGVLPAEMSDVNKGFSDMLMHYTKTIFQGMLNETFAKNASRKEQGYTARCVVRSMICRVMHRLTTTRSLQEAVQQLCLVNYADAISIHEVPSISYTFLASGIDLGVVLMCMVAARQFDDFPVLLPSELIDFLDNLDKPVRLVCDSVLVST